MAAPLYVLGHKNPDSDSICAAIGYATLLQLQGHADAVAARQGPLRRETEYVLRRFGIEPPALVTDVRPRVADIMTNPPVVVNQTMSLLEVGKTLQEHRIRTVPVVDDEQRLQGVIGVQDLAGAFIADLDPNQLDRVRLDMHNLVRTLEGQVLVDPPGRELRDQVMVGAMEIDSMLGRLEPGILLVVGDREDAQRAAIEFGVGAIVVTGDHPVSQGIIDLAAERQVAVIAVPHHTYTTVRLIRLSTPVRNIMRTEAPVCGPDDVVDDVRETLGNSTDRFMVVVDGDGVVLGMVSRSNLLRSIHRQVVLVDHNERGQTVEGIEDAEIVGVIDHHRVADFQTRSALFMRMQPVGSTSTIVAQLFDESDVDVSPAIAGVLLSGILADTLLFNGPTTTPVDRTVAESLAQRSGIDPRELGERILNLASDVSDRSAEQLLMADFKEFNAAGNQFGIGTIETTNASDVLARQSEMMEALENARSQGYACVIFAVIDIVNKRTTLFVAGNSAAVAEAFGLAPPEDHALEVPGILSRKKNIVPLLGTISRAMDRR
ncbi:MAG: putative manganese-dependent inorganic diphosphatase [Chloroflexota bacterium]